MTTEPVPDVLCSHDRVVCLPNEIWHQIFSHMPFRKMVVSVSPVCKKWYDFAHDARLWRRVVFKNVFRIPKPVIEHLIVFAPLLQQLQIVIRIGHDDIVELLCISFERLVAIDISCSSLSTSSWRHIATHARWPLQRCGLDQCNITDEVVNELVPRFRCLEVLSLNYCTLLTDTSLKAIACNLPRLRNLSFAGCRDESGFLSLIEHLGDVLEYITLGGRYLTYASIQNLRKLTRLHTFAMTRTPALTDATLLDGIRPLGRHLKWFGLSGYTELTEAGLCALFDINRGGGGDHFTGLTHLELSRGGVTDAVMAAVARCCGACLVNLSIEHCDEVTDPGLAHILAASATGGSALTHLNIAYVHRVTDEALHHVATQLPHLRYLNAFGCRGLSGALLLRLHAALPVAAIYDVSGTRLRSPDTPDSDLDFLKNPFCVDVLASNF